MGGRFRKERNCNFLGKLLGPQKASEWGFLQTSNGALDA